MQNYRSFSKLSLISFVIFLWTNFILAQATGLKGIIRDKNSGEPLPGANVIISSESPGVNTGTASSNNGEFHILNLSAGIYKIIVSYIGYEKFVLETIELKNDEIQEIEIVLNPTGLQVNPITVTASRRQERMLDAPVSVNIIDAKTIESRTALTPTEHLKALPAIDIITAGLNQSRVAVRGFNDLFSGSMLTMVDNRMTHIPSVRLNAFQLIPISNQDVEQIELLSGPASALYGPNSAQGVMHVITKSPFDSKGTDVSVGGGERSMIIGTARHAGLITDNIGYKLSMQYYEGQDFESFDPLEQAAKEDAIRAGNPDSARIAARIFDIRSTAFDSRLDWKISPDLTLITNGGFSHGDNIEITDQGAAQALNATFYYLQGRLLYKNFFFQSYLNKINTGDTYLLRTGDDIINRSSLFVTQAQHHFKLNDLQNFTYGIDVLLTRPDTEGTVNGRNENNDNVNEVGAYLQSETFLSTKIKLVTAARLDHHNRLDGLNFSPRAALVYKPTPYHNFRLTYNRAFSTPTPDHLFSDIDARRVPTASLPNGQLLERFIGDTFFNIRSLGTWPDGFTFRYGTDGRPMMVSSFHATNNYLAPDVNSIWPELRAFILAGMPEIIRDNAEKIIPTTLSQTVPGIFQSVNPEAKDESEAFKPTDPSFVENIKPAFEMTNTTFEFGFKGALTPKIITGLDVYHSRFNNFIGPLKVETPNVFIDIDRLEAVLIADFVAQGLTQPDAELIAKLITRTEQEVDGQKFSLASLPIGIISPIQVQNGTDVIITNRNIGDVAITGMDLSLTYSINKNWNLTSNYSFVNRDYFKSANGYRDIALNAPKHKFGAILNYNKTDDSFRSNLRLRFIDGFPVNSGIFTGTVNSYLVLDLNTDLRLPFSHNTHFTLTVQNLTNNRHKEFVGVPEIGRLAWVRLTQTL